MPYSSMDDVNPAIKGIDPPVTLSQANTIAEWADKIEAEGEADNPWAVAIAQFKKAYKVEGDKWVKRERGMNPVRQLWEGIQRLFEPLLREWDGSASNYESTEAYCSACLIDVNAAAGRDEKAQTHCKLPVKSPGSDGYNWDGIKAAAGALSGARGGLKKPDDVPDDKWSAAVKSAANTIISQYNSHDEQAPDSVYKAAGKEAPERAVGLGRLFNQLDLALYESSDHSMAWLHDIYRDDDGSLFAIASERGKLYRVGLEFSDEGAILGEWVPVSEEFKPIGEARTRIIRQADGRYRWLSISCTSVLNRVGEIDSQALFDSFVEHAEETGEYPYRTFYHQGEALRTGQCDYMARDGSVFITSGLYDDDNPLAAAEIQAMERDAGRWGESIGYLPTAEPEMVEIASDVSIPVYNAGVIREISTLPNDSAAAWFTTIRTQEVRRMRKEVFEALLELVDDEEKAKGFAALVDGTNREIQEGDLVSREAGTEEPLQGGAPANETPGPDPEPPEIEREVVLDQAAVDLITAQFAEMLAPFTEKIEGLEAQLAAMAGDQSAAADEARQAREALDTRLKAVERDEDDKQRQWLADMPRKETLNVTHRPREANRPEGDDEPARPNPSAVLDAAGVPAY